MNAGKVFENDFKKSVPAHMWFYRFRDGTATFYDGMDRDDGIRFQQTNICDCLIFHNGLLVLAELKSSKGKSVSFKNLREKQVKELFEITVSGIRTGFIFNMRDIEETYWIDAWKVKEYMDFADRKSFPIDWMRSVGIPVNTMKLKVHYRYGVAELVERLGA
jgi:recombination protein U